MMHYDNGTREAEFLARSAPDRVDHWLRKARTDRHRWIIRLFRPALREFLDGFIAGLEASARQPKPDVPAAPPRIQRVVSPRVAPSEAIARDLPTAPIAAPAAEREAPRPVEAPPPPPPVASASPAPAPPAASVEVRPAPSPESEQPPVPPATHTDFARVEQPDGDHGIGVFRLSSWSPGDRPRESAPASGVQLSAKRVPPPAQPPPEIVWTNAMEQARTVGVVDLSAYDTLEYLNEVRDLFDRRESLRNGVAGPEDPRAR